MRMFLKPTAVLVFATVAAIVLILQKNFSVAYHLRKQIARRHSSKAKRFVSKRTCERWGSDTSPGAWLTAGNTPLPCVVHRAGSIRSRSNGVGVHGVPKILSPMGPRPWIGVWLTSWKHAPAFTGYHAELSRSRPNGMSIGLHRKVHPTIGPIGYRLKGHSTSPKVARFDQVPLASYW